MSVQSLLFPLARRFVAGEEPGDALDAVRRLNAAGISATIDVLGEDVSDASAADRMRDGYLDLIGRLGAAGFDTNLSLKLSGLGLRLDPAAALERFATVLIAAATLRDPFVRVDMEGSALCATTIDAVVAAHARHPNTGPALQAYLHRTPADAERMSELGIRVRLCKGAYRETPEIALQRAHDVRVQYVALATGLLQRGTYPAFATHDPLIMEAVGRVARTHGVATDRFEFQLLYGVREDLQRSLVAQGYRVRVYVPFGTHWAKYFRRRVGERRENLLFALRSLAGR